MERLHTTYISIIIFVLSVLIIAIARVYGKNFYVISLIFLFILILMNSFLSYKSEKETKKCHEIAEKAVLSKFGSQVTVEFLARPTSNYDKVLHGITGTPIPVKFRCGPDIYKGIVDAADGSLYIKEPVLLPVYSEELIPVWKDVTNVHKNGLPKRVEFYDSDELLHRVDCLDERGNLVKESWRRNKGTVEYWNQKKQVWEQVP